MNNKQLIEYKENIFTKIKNFFKNIFRKKQVNSNIEKTAIIPEEIKKENYKIDKKEFMDIYEKSKTGDIDLFTIPVDKLEKMCILLEEEIKIKERNLDEKRNKLKAMQN